MRPNESWADGNHVYFAFDVAPAPGHEIPRLAVFAVDAATAEMRAGRVLSLDADEELIALEELPF